MSKKLLSEEQVKEVTDALIKGNKIEAIKIFRDATGLGLREAKETIEEIGASLSEEFPEVMKKSSGCMSVIAIGTLVIVYLMFDSYGYISSL